MRFRMHVLWLGPALKTLTPAKIQCILSFGTYNRSLGIFKLVLLGTAKIQAAF